MSSKAITHYRKADLDAARMLELLRWKRRLCSVVRGTWCSGGNDQGPRRGELLSDVEGPVKSECELSVIPLYYSELFYPAAFSDLAAEQRGRCLGCL